jgi:hypothetical protein
MMTTSALLRTETVWPHPLSHVDGITNPLFVLRTVLIAGISSYWLREYSIRRPDGEETRFSRVRETIPFPRMLYKIYP